MVPDAGCADHGCAPHPIPSHPRSGVAQVAHRLAVLHAELLHFVHAVQYYAMFEVLESAWAELRRRIDKAADLDDVIVAHEAFLAVISERLLLGPESGAALQHLRSMLNLALQFRQVQSDFFAAALDELVRSELPHARAGGRSNVAHLAEPRIAAFLAGPVRSTSARLAVICRSHRTMAARFMTMLRSHTDESLRFLSLRLNYNAFYTDTTTSTATEAIHDAAATAAPSATAANSVHGGS